MLSEKDTQSSDNLKKFLTETDNRSKMLVMDKGDVMEAEWIKWGGGKQPVRDGTIVEYETAIGSISCDPADRLFWEWRRSGTGGGDIVAYRVAQQENSAQPAPITSDGGSSDYYKLTIKNKAGETIQCEMGDIIRAVVDNDFDLGNILKAARRMSLAKQGSGKAGTTVTYDANKIKYFADEFAFWHEAF